MEYFTINNLVWAMFFAILTAVIYTFIMQRSLSALASRILEKKADSEETALTLEELGYKGGLASALAGFFAKNGNSISKAIVKVEKDGVNRNTELLFEKKPAVKYYIPADKNDKRLEKHINDNMSVVKLIVVVLILAAVAFAAETVINMLSDYAGTLIEGGGEKVYGTEQDETTLLEEQAQANKEEELQKQEEEELEKIKEQAEKELEAAQNTKQPEAQDSVLSSHDGSDTQTEENAE